MAEWRIRKEFGPIVMNLPFLHHQQFWDPGYSIQFSYRLAEVFGNEYTKLLENKM
jgi:hypothetical protein